MSNEVPLEVLEQRAAEQRKSIHQSVEDLRQLKTGVEENVREKLDLKRQAREHFWPVVGIASLLGLVVGHGVASVLFD